MTTFYISGPMDEYPQHNYPAFHKAGEELKKSGVKILSPAHDMSGNPLQPPRTEEEYLWQEHLRQSLQKLVLCDAIHMLKGWETSPNAGLEYRIALTLGMTTTFQYQGQE